MTRAEKQALEKALERYGEGKQSDYGVHDKQTYELTIEGDHPNKNLGDYEPEWVGVAVFLVV
ncbi:hypothetical protein RYX53_14940 [Alkalibacillus haloalkaliphilus]|nr:hypothetical protein [Alkalibacillus haloalkaliphilus]